MFVFYIELFMMNVITKTITMGDGSTITIETGKALKQADGAVTVRMGNNCIVGHSYCRL